MTKSKGKYYLVGGEHDMDDYEKQLDDYIKIFRDIDPQQDLALKYISKEAYIRKITKIVDSQYNNLKKRGGTKTDDSGSPGKKGKKGKKADEIPEENKGDEIPDGPHAAIEEEVEDKKDVEVEVEEEEEDDPLDSAFLELSAPTYVRKVEAIKTFLGNTIESLYDAVVLDKSREDLLTEQYDPYYISRSRERINEITNSLKSHINARREELNKIIESLTTQPMLFLKNDLTNVTDIKDGRSYAVRKSVCEKLFSRGVSVDWSLDKKEKGYVTEELASPLLQQLVPGAKSTDILSFFDASLQFAEFDIVGEDMIIDVKANDNFLMYCDRAKIEKMPVIRQDPETNKIIIPKQGYICWPWNTRRGDGNPNELDLNVTGPRTNRYNNRLLLLKVPQRIEDRDKLLAKFKVNKAGLIFFGDYGQYGKFTTDMFMVKTRTEPLKRITLPQLHELAEDIIEFGPKQFS